MAEQGAVSWMFEKKGVVVASVKGKSLEEIELFAIDAGAEDLEIHDDTLHATTAGTAWGKLRDALKAAGCSIEEAGLKFVPKEFIEISDTETQQRISELLSALEEDDDVSLVHTNAR